MLLYNHCPADQICIIMQSITHNSGQSSRCSACTFMDMNFFRSISLYGKVMLDVMLWSSCISWVCSYRLDKDMKLVACIMHLVTPSITCMQYHLQYCWIRIQTYVYCHVPWLQLHDSPGADIQGVMRIRTIELMRSMWPREKSGIMAM